jgi:carbon monoxide dehydrogenase subunit G
VAIPIEERFEVAAPIEQVWDYFKDPPQVVPCIPGAELIKAVDETTYEGAVGLQVGPVRAKFRGTVIIENVDAEKRTMALVARGTQQGAQGRAEAQVQFGLQSLDEQRTEVIVKADVSIAGKLAQMGGGMIQNVSRQIFRKFAECARNEILDNDASANDKGQKRKEGGVATD